MINCINTQGEDERKLMWQATGPPKGKYTLMNIGGQEIALDLFYKLNAQNMLCFQLNQGRTMLRHEVFAMSETWRECASLVLKECCRILFLLSCPLPVNMLSSHWPRFPLVYWLK